MGTNPLIPEGFEVVEEGQAPPVPPGFEVVSSPAFTESKTEWGPLPDWFVPGSSFNTDQVSRGDAFALGVEENVDQQARGFLQLVPSLLKTLSVLGQRLIASPGSQQMQIPGGFGTTVGAKGPGPTARPESAPLYKAGAEVDKILSAAFPEPEERDVWHDINRGLGQGAQMLVGGAAMKGLGASTRLAGIGASTMGGVQEFDDAFQRARHGKDDPDEAFAKALGYASVATMIENRLGAGRLLRQLFPSAGDAVQKLTALGVSKRTLGNFLAGGAEEGSQRFAQNWIVDEEPSMEGVREEAVPGAVVQTILGIPGSGVVGTRERNESVIAPSDIRNRMIAQLKPAAPAIPPGFEVVKSGEPSLTQTTPMPEEEMVEEEEKTEIETATPDLPIEPPGWNAARAAYVEKLKKPFAPAIMYDDGNVIPGSTHGTLIETAKEGTKPVASGWTTRTGEFFEGSAPPERTKPEWVRNLEAIDPKNRNEDQVERLTKWEQGEEDGPVFYEPELAAPSQLEGKFKGVQDSNQMLNWLRNTNPAESKLLEEAGIREAFEGKRVAPKEIVDWIKENGPKVEVHSYGMEGKVSEAKREYDKMTHEWYDNLTGMEQEQAGLVTPVSKETGISWLMGKGWTKENAEKAIRRQELVKQIEKEGRDTSPRATSAYDTVSAFPTTEPMPEWTKSREGKNVQRVDVVVPSSQRTKDALLHGLPQDTDKTLFWSPDNLHENLPNTLGWAMIQYTTGPNGEKIAVVVEAQSRWGQTIRELKNNPERGPGREIQARNQNHPLLRDYNRLILKAAIEQARKEGATHIVVSDAETAMMTEGHDARENAFVAPPDNWEGTTEDWLKTQKPEISQEPGMRLNYDKTYWTLKDKDGKLVKEAGPWKTEQQALANAKEGQTPVERPGVLNSIAEELTGAKGERVELGEHKNAMEKHGYYEGSPSGTGPAGGIKSTPRPNLIFRNPDGTPKTSISGLMFPLGNTRESFSLLGKDKPEKKASEPESGGTLSPDSRQLIALGVNEKGSTALSALRKMILNAKLFSDSERAMALFLVQNFEAALGKTTLERFLPDTGNTQKAGRAFYSPNKRAINLALGHSRSSIAFRLLHEAGHAATYWQLEHPVTEVQKRAAAEIRRLRAESEKSLPADAGSNLRYYHSNDTEFIAGIFSSEEMRTHLNGIKDANASFWQKIWSAIKELLGVKKGTLLETAFDELYKVGKEGYTNEAERKARSGNVAYAPPGSDPLPWRPKPNAQEKAENTEPRFLGKVPLLSRLFDPRAYKNTPAEKVLLSNAIMKYKGENATALWMEGKKDEERSFAPDEEGRVTLADGTKTYLADVVEAEIGAPGSQKLTAGQKAFVTEWKEINEEMIRLAAAEGVKFFIDEDGNPKRIDDPYFPRPRVGTRGEESKLKQIFTGKKPGQKPGAFKERAYKTEAAGAAAKVEYEADEYARVASWMQGVYSAIADARLANDPDLGGRAGVRLVPIKDHKGVERYMKVGKGPRYGEGTVYGVPALEGKVFSAEQARRLREFYDQHSNKYFRWAAIANDTIKGVKFAGDVSAPMNQGLPLLFYRPGRWVKAAVGSYKAFLITLGTKESMVLNGALKNSETARVAKIIVANGGSVGRLQDFLTGTKKGALATRVPVFGRLVRAGGESMGTFLSLAKIELFKSLEPLAKANGTSEAELVEIVENMVLSGRMEGLGLSSGRMLTERLLFNAPSYLRAFAALAVEGAKGAGKGVTGQKTNMSERVARNSITSLMGSLMMLMYAVYRGMDLDDDEILERLDPRSSRFLRVRTVLNENDSVELSFGNIFLSAARLLGETASVVTGEKEIREGVKGNPWLRWLSYRKSPIIQLMWEMATGEDYRGRPTGAITSLGRAVVPISAEPAFDPGTGGVAKGVEGATTFLGGSSFPAREKSAAEIVERLGGGSIKERVGIAKDAQKRDKAPVVEQMLAQKRASENEMRRREKVRNDLSSEMNDFLDKYRLQLPAYSSGFSKAGVKVPLTRDERKREQAYVTEEYEKELRRWTEKYANKLEGWSKDRTLQSRVNHRLAFARAQAKKKLIKEIK